MKFLFFNRVRKLLFSFLVMIHLERKALMLKKTIWFEGD